MGTLKCDACRHFDPSTSVTNIHCLDCRYYIDQYLRTSDPHPPYAYPSVRPDKFENRAEFEEGSVQIRRMDDLGRIAIPKAIRYQLFPECYKGDDVCGKSFKIYVESGKIILEPTEEEDTDE